MPEFLTPLQPPVWWLVYGPGAPVLCRPWALSACAMGGLYVAACLGDHYDPILTYLAAHLSPIVARAWSAAVTTALLASLTFTPRRQPTPHTHRAGTSRAAHTQTTTPGGIR